MSRWMACGLLAVAALAGLAACSPPPTAPQSRADEATPWFEEEAAKRGLAFTHVSGASGDYLLPEIMGGGGALVDVDGDGDLDIYLVQSGYLQPDKAPAGATTGSQLYLNRGDGHFSAAAHGGAQTPGYGIGVTAGDYDNDGDVDLYVTRVGPNALLRNDGRGHFEDVTAMAGVGDPGFSTAATFFDADADGDLDLFVVNYVAWSPGVERDCHDFGTGVRNYCDPGNYKAPSQDRLYRNDGDGTFTDVSAISGIADAAGNGLGVVTADFNGDGRQDVFVANDKTMNHLWLNQGGLRFHEEALLWGCAIDDAGVTKAGMGVAAADVDDDADVDLMVVNIEGETDSFFRNSGGYFVDAASEAGLGTTSRRYTRFGVALSDFDNDGWLDVYEANGRVTYSPEPEAADVYAEPNVLMRGTPPGRFELVPRSGVAEPLVHTGRGVAIGDVNGDGGLDLLVINRDARPYLLINRIAGSGGFARFRVLAANGRDAHGASVTATVGGARKSRDVQVAGSYLAAHEPVVHFGLGVAEQVTDVTVHWPSGEREVFGNFAAGSTHLLRQGAGKPVGEPG